jgi:hypothetical protein
LATTEWRQQRPRQSGGDRAAVFKAPLACGLGEEIWEDTQFRGLFRLVGAGFFSRATKFCVGLLELVFSAGLRNFVIRTGRAGDALRLSLALSSKSHHLNKYFLSFTAQDFLYSIGFHNQSHSSSSKSILYINYHPYFTIFPTTNFISLILISTTIYYFILIYISIIFYFYYSMII